MDEKLQWAITRIMDKVDPQFFGSFTLVFQEGKLTHIKTDQTEIPPKPV